ncbi:hypothetical protein H6P81_006595 [Aristolochia fimbriata]|uniref:Retrotransposon gag domain-containing protein n=1 Tax=Aristolochia fimbriata TaxID=158543 RepID=A0AAV7F1G4_ARIFI|nr:hypothetical protein H6P81_006595 [Aristolochia fimbriata]
MAKISVATSAAYTGDKSYKAATSTANKDHTWPLSQSKTAPLFKGDGTQKRSKQVITTPINLVHAVGTRSSEDPLAEPDPEPERSLLQRRRRENSAMEDQHEEEDPNEHIERFLELCDTFKFEDVTNEAVWLRLFPFTLRDRAKSWLSTLQPDSIRTWDELQKKFLGKYFPPAKTIKLRNAISNFMQEHDEQLFEAWERYKELLRKCPNHGIPRWMQMEIFYNGIIVSTRSLIDAAAGGTMNKKTPNEVYELIEEMTSNFYQYPVERSARRRVAAIHNVDHVLALQAQVESLTKQLSKLHTPSVVAQICDMCGGGHPTTLNSPMLKQDHHLVSKEKLNLGELKETNIMLQFANRSTKKPTGLFEDVLVRIGKFIYPCDFMVLDMEVDWELPLILGRPFLATAAALLDVKQGKLTLRLNDEEIVFNIKQAIKRPSNSFDDTCYFIDVIDECAENVQQEIIMKDNLERCLAQSCTKEDDDHLMQQEVKQENKEKEKGAKIKDPSKLELKPLPSSLKYVYLEDDSKPVIISSCLNAREEQLLIDVLSKHKKAIGWTISDIKGISPITCMHKILMDDSFKPTIQPQRRINPTLREVVDKCLNNTTFRP